MNSDQIRKAFLTWYSKYDYREIDKKVLPFLADEIGGSQGDWLRKVREALFLSTGHVAKKLGISRAAYAKLEIKEQTGSVTLKTMATVAEALDCDLIYALRPKQKKRFAEIIWEKLVPKASSHNWVKTRPEKLKSRALAAAAQWTMDDAQFRRDQNWSQRH